MAKQILTINGIARPTLKKEDEKAIREFSEATSKVKEEVDRVKARQATALERTEVLKGELDIGTVDLLTVENDKSRSDLLGNRKKLKDELEEEELYLHVDLGAYIKRLYAQYEVKALQVKAEKAETAIYNNANTYIDAIEKLIEEISEERDERFGLFEQYNYGYTIDNTLSREIIKLNKKPVGQPISKMNY